MSRSGPFSESRPQLPALTGLRGVGAVFVALYHLLESENIIGLKSGFLGVDLFFILSGFVISYAHPVPIRSVTEYGRFLYLRLARIYPLHLFVMLVLLLIVLYLPGYSNGYSLVERRFSADAFVASLLLIQNWFYWLPTCWNAPAWSLSAEWFAYLAFPVFAVISYQFRSAWKPAAAAIAGFVVLAAIFRLKHFEYNAAGSPGMCRMVVEFGAGCLLYRAWINGLVLPDKIAGVAAIAGIVVAVLMPALTLLVLPAFAAFVMLGAQRHGRLARLLSTPILMWMGDISYSLYLTHSTIIQVSNWLSDGVAMSVSQDVLHKICIAVVMLIVASATCRWVEKPARTFARRLGQRSLRQPASAAMR